MLKLQESGKLAKMKNRWWKEERGGGKCVVSHTHALHAVDNLDSECIQYHVVMRLIYLFACQCISQSVSHSVSDTAYYGSLVVMVCHILRLEMAKVAANILDKQS